MSETLPATIIEKRRHKLYVTKNTEYHVKDNVCVGIRNRATGDWIMVSRAIGAVLIGGLHQAGEHEVNFSSYPWLEKGDCLLFITDGGHDIVTTRVEQVDRPSRQSIRYYRRAA